jgi:hypothetical protein
MLLMPSQISCAVQSAARFKPRKPCGYLYKISRISRRLAMLSTWDFKCFMAERDRKHEERDEVFVDSPARGIDEVEASVVELTERRRLLSRSSYSEVMSASLITLAQRRRSLAISSANLSGGPPRAIRPCLSRIARTPGCASISLNTAL